MADSRLLTRLKKVEASGPGKARVFLWAGHGQDAAAVEADHVAGHPGDAGKVLVLAWAEAPR